VRWGPWLTLGATSLVLLAGGYLTARWLIRPLRDLERASRALGNGDFAARVGSRRQDELGTLARTFDGMAAQVESMLRAERTMMATVSHELRTPLARIRVAVELVEEGEPAMAQAALEDISEDLAEMEALIDDILASARLERASVTSREVVSCNREVVDPRELLRSAVRRFSSRYPRRRVKLRLPQDHCPMVDVHHVLWRRAVENLLENAHKYAESPQATIEVTLQEHPEAGELSFAVQNPSQGLSQQDQERLFEPFYRGAADGGQKPGWGLGLALVQRIVQAHGGRATLQSSPQQGTVVALWLPTLSPESD
jgi:signal transduction histidine kinase